MISRHLGQYKGNFYIMDEVLTGNLTPTKAPVIQMRFEIVRFLYRCAFNLVCLFKCLRFHNRFHRCEQEAKMQRYPDGA